MRQTITMDTVPTASPSHIALKHRVLHTTTTNGATQERTKGGGSPRRDGGGRRKRPPHGRNLTGAAMLFWTVLLGISALVYLGFLLTPSSSSSTPLASEKEKEEEEERPERKTLRFERWTDRRALERKRRPEETESYHERHKHRFRNAAMRDQNRALANLPSLKPNEIRPVTWTDSEGNFQQMEYAVRVGLPERLTPTLQSYFDRLGLHEAAWGLLGNDQVEAGHAERYDLGGLNWLGHRPKTHENSDMHWIETADKACHESYLGVLEEGGFDSVLNALGEHFNLDGLVAYHLSVLVVSHYWDEFFHWDFKDTGKKAFNILIPLDVVDDPSMPELVVSTDEDGTVASYVKYEYGVAAVIGDDAEHASAETPPGDMRLMVSVYVADVTDENAQNIADDHTNYKYPPWGDADFLLQHRHRHWRKDGGASLSNKMLNYDSAKKESGGDGRDKYAAHL